MRGEYIRYSLNSSKFMELPPRARRILAPTPAHYPHLGTTSACAENTQPSTQRTHRLRNYLRVRGEYLGLGHLWLPVMELPPRARRIQTERQSFPNRKGTTSACAENTPGGVGREARTGNYLRVRGEYPKPNPSSPWGLELPPRARRIPPTLVLHH